MSLTIRPQSECKYDLISLGEIMLRLDPGKAEYEHLVNSMPGRVGVSIMLPVDCAVALV